MLVGARVTGIDQAPQIHDFPASTDQGYCMLSAFCPGDAARTDGT